MREGVREGVRDGVRDGVAEEPGPTPPDGVRVRVGVGVLDGVAVTLGVRVTEAVRLAVLVGVRVKVTVAVALGVIEADEGKTLSVEVAAVLPARKMGSIANTPSAMIVPTMATTAKAMRRSRQRGLDSSISHIINFLRCKR